MDWVRRVGKRGVGKIERLTDGDRAWVDWLDGRHTLEQLTWLRRAPARDLDARKR